MIPGRCVAKAVVVALTLCMGSLTAVRSAAAGDGGTLPPRDVSHLKGAVPPANLDVIAPQRAHIANQLLELFAQEGTSSPSFQFCHASASHFDWRDYHVVTPVRDQGAACRSCWAFAAIATLESNYLLVHGAAAAATLHASEQQALDCAPDGYDCQHGGWHDRVFLNLYSKHGASESIYGSYEGEKRVCRLPLPADFSLKNFSPIAPAAIASDAAIKQALCDHGPIVTAVKAENWEKTLPDGRTYIYSTKNPNWKATFPNGVFAAGFASDPNLTMTKAYAGEIDHEVEIVGWNDALGVWIVKNSWGPNWGDNGIMFLKYGTDNVGFDATWVDAHDQNANFDTRFLNARELIDPSWFGGTQR